MKSSHFLTLLPCALEWALFHPLYILFVINIFQLYCDYFHLLLSVQEQFPHRYQMSPKDTSLPLAMVSLAVHFRWNWVGVIVTDDDQGIQFLSELRTGVEKSTVCVAFVTIITYDWFSYVKMIHKYYHQIITSSAKVVIVYGDKESLIQYNFMLWKSKNVQRLWVSVSQFDMITMIGEFMLHSLHGALIFSHQHSEMSGFKQFMQTVNTSNYSNDISLLNCGGLSLNVLCHHLIVQHWRIVQAKSYLIGFLCHHLECLCVKQATIYTMPCMLSPTLFMRCFCNK